MKKKFLAILICVCALFTMLGISSCFDLETIEVDGYSLCLKEDGTYAIVGIPEEVLEQTTWEIPVKIGDYSISQVGLHYANSLVSMREAIDDFGKIRRMVVPKNISRISAENAGGVVIFETETTPSSIYLGGGFYYGNFWWYSPQEEMTENGREYRYLTAENFVGDLVFTSETKQVYDEETGIETTGESATLLYGLGSGNLVIPETYNGIPVREIGYRAFHYSLYTSVEIGDHIQAIGAETFSHSTVETVTLPETCTTITTEMFSNSELSSIEIPATVTAIAQHAFSGCNLTAITLPVSVTEIGIYAFSNTPLENVDLSACSIDEIAGSIFRNCPLTGTLLLPNTIKRIGNNAFEGAKMETFAFPEKVEIIYGEAFRNVPLLNIELPSGIKEIRDRAFADNTALTELIIPDSCESFEETAIYGCTNLTKLHLGNLRDFEYVESACEKLDEITVSPTNDFLFIRDGMLFTPKLLIKCPNSLQVETLVLTDCAVARNACLGQQTLKEVLMQSNGKRLLTIGEYAFYGCTGLETVVLSDQVEIISGDAFNGCTSLSNINLERVTRIGHHAFYNCSSLEEINLKQATNIGEFAFEGCDLRSVHTYQVKSIGRRAFANNVNLKKVTLENCDYVAWEAFTGCKSLTKYSDGGAEHGTDVFTGTPLQVVSVGCKRALR